MYAYVVQPKCGGVSEVFLGNSETSEDVQDFCAKIDARWAIVGHHRYILSKGNQEYKVTKIRVTER